MLFIIINFVVNFHCLWSQMWSVMPMMVIKALRCHCLSSEVPLCTNAACTVFAW